MTYFQVNLLFAFLFMGMAVQEIVNTVETEVDPETTLYTGILGVVFNTM